MCEDFKYVAIPRSILRRVAFDLSFVNPSTAEDHWVSFSRVIQESVTSDPGSPELLAAGTLRSPQANWRQRHRSQSRSSLNSSPTLYPFSRETSKAPEGTEVEDSQDEDTDVPILDLEFEAQTGTDAAAGTTVTNRADTSLIRGTKRNTNHPDAPQITEGQPENSDDPRVRRRVVVMPWECPRNGNLKALPRQRSQPQFRQGFPMVDGPNGPEIDMDIEEEDDARGNEESGEGCETGGAELRAGGLDDSGSEEEPPKKQKQRSTRDGQTQPKGTRRKMGEEQWKVLARKHRTNRDAIDLVLIFSKMSSQRHQQSLPGFISDICGSARLSSSPIISSSLNSSDLSTLSTMLAHVDNLISDTKILDFYRMIALMQVSLWLDW